MQLLLFHFIQRVKVPVDHSSSDPSIYTIYPIHFHLIFYFLLRDQQCTGYSLRCVKMTSCECPRAAVTNYSVLAHLVVSSSTMI
ncbi:hypothetical protein EVAR_65028_1 [Eumeta japonica]|uniref:Uncharacterized protein n=1 Tax=Eumeta variegata TaxID=151549 RepID=A0A4C1YTV8_EUMVA|nr:hypothetical protein EVAR_65028_1 [Eumeta japonica]